VSTNSVVSATLKATRSIPIVFTWVSDPVGSGFVANLPRPGGNITGFHNFEPAIGGKWVAFLNRSHPICAAWQWCMFQRWCQTLRSCV
jgi:ABC transporter substrate binding protein